MRIVSFGHLPSWAGGLQESGLANVIYQLAKHGSAKQGVEVVLAATDSFLPQRRDNKLTILGWTKIGLLWYILTHPLSSIHSLFFLSRVIKRYPFKESFWALFAKRIFLTKTIRTIQPDIVHLHGPHAIWYLDIPAPLSKKVVTFHGMTGLDNSIEQYNVLHDMERDVFHSNMVSEVFFICTKLVSSFKKAYGDNGKNNQVIFNSYDNTQFYYAPQETLLMKKDDAVDSFKPVITFCTIASLSELKGQFRVLTSISKNINKKRIKYFCIGADSSGLADKMINFACKNDISFSYLGKMSPEMIRKELIKADYMIMPSSSEGFGLTYLESIACGVPVILPQDIPIAEERALINSTNSILLHDCSEESITEVISHIDNYHFNREKVSESISGYSWDDIAGQYISAFKKLI